MRPRGPHAGRRPGRRHRPGLFRSASAPATVAGAGRLVSRDGPDHQRSDPPAPGLARDRDWHFRAIAASTCRAGVRRLEGCRPRSNRRARKPTCQACGGPPRRRWLRCRCVRRTEHRDTNSTRYFARPTFAGTALPQICSGLIDRGIRRPFQCYDTCGSIAAQMYWYVCHPRFVNAYNAPGQDDVAFGHPLEAAPTNVLGFDMAFVGPGQYPVSLADLEPDGLHAETIAHVSSGFPFFC